jgi:hypothetical protein
MINARYAGAADSPATQTALAMYGASPPATQVASAAPAAISAQATPALDNANFLSQIPDIRSATAAAATSDGGNNNPSSNDRIFRSLFQVDDRSQPVSNAVRQLWGSSASLTADAGATAATASGNSGAVMPLDLFSDRSGTFSS